MDNQEKEHESLASKIIEILKEIPESLRTQSMEVAKQYEESLCSLQEEEMQMFHQIEEVHDKSDSLKRHCDQQMDQMHDSMLKLVSHLRKDDEAT